MLDKDDKSSVLLMTIYYTSGLHVALISNKDIHTYPITKNEHLLYKQDLYELKNQLEINKALGTRQKYVFSPSSGGVYILHRYDYGIIILGPFTISGENKKIHKDPKVQNYYNSFPEIHYIQINFLKIMLIALTTMNYENMPDILYNVESKEDISVYKSTLLYDWNKYISHPNKSKLENALYTIFSSHNILEVRLKLRNLWKEYDDSLPPLSEDSLQSTKNMLISSVRTFSDFAIKWGSEENIATTLCYNTIKEIDKKIYIYDAIYIFEEYVIQLYKIVNIESDKQYSNLVNKAIKIINRDCKINLKIKDIANELECSPKYLSKIFHEEVGQTIIYYKNDVKINFAKTLLNYSNSSILEISTLLNFNSIHQFSKLFKKHTTMSPSEFRRTYFAEHN